MIVQAKTQLHTPCPGCTVGHFRADHLSIGFSTRWACDKCHKEFTLTRVSEHYFETELTGKTETPITVTLQSITEPKITLKLNTWKYAHSQNDTPDEFYSYTQYFYDEHTCPTNWVGDIVQIEFQGDTDPHGVFQFVSVEDGHFEDPN